MQGKDAIHNCLYILFFIGHFNVIVFIFHDFDNNQDMTLCLPEISNS